MKKSQILNTKESFQTEFAKCCREYDTLNIVVAWCGDPGKTLPYNILTNFRGAISVLVGVAFDHTHPDAF